MSNAIDVSLHALGAETASGTGTSVDAGSDIARTAARLQLHVLALSGSDTPSLTVAVETSPDDTTWRTAFTFPVTTAVGKAWYFPGGLDRYVRISWTITGTTPSFTFEMTGAAHVIYAEIEDLYSMGLPSSALTNVSTSDKNRALIAASSVADVDLNRVYTLPLSAWGESLKRIVSGVAAWDLRRVKGFKPEGVDQIVKYNYEDAKTALRMLEDKTKPPDIVDATPDTFDAGVVIYSDNSRGW